MYISLRDCKTASKKAKLYEGIVWEELVVYVSKILYMAAKNILVTRIGRSKSVAGVDPAQDDVQGVRWTKERKSALTKVN